MSGDPRCLTCGHPLVDHSHRVSGHERCDWQGCNCTLTLCAYCEPVAGPPPDTELMAGGREFMAMLEQEFGPIPEHIVAEVRRKWNVEGDPHVG